MYSYSVAENSYTFLVNTLDGEIRGLTVRNDFHSETGTVKLCVCNEFIAANVSSVGAEVQQSVPWEASPSTFELKETVDSSHATNEVTQYGGYCIYVLGLWCISLVTSPQIFHMTVLRPGQLQVIITGGSLTRRTSSLGNKKLLVNGASIGSSTVARALSGTVVVMVGHKVENFSNRKHDHGTFAL
jgi:hypothetical protein